MMPVEYVRRQLEKACDALGSQKKFSSKHGISQPYINDVLLGRREPGKKILGALKMKKVTGYVYIVLVLSMLTPFGVAEANEPTREGIPVNGSAPDINYGIVRPISPKKVVIPYDDFLKIIASKEHSDKLRNQCAAEREILVKLKDEQGKTISIQADQVKGLIETAEMQEKLGATEAQINEALQVQLAKLTGDLDREKRLSRYKSEAFWLGMIAVGLWVVN